MAPPGGSGRSVLYRDAALTDARSDRLEVGFSLLVAGGRIAWIRPLDSEGDLSGQPDLEVVDASGTTIVPAMVDCHSHLTLPGGAHWIERCSDPPEVLLRVAEDNARLQLGSGVRWARDVGAPVGVDPEDGRERALSLGLRDRWKGRRDHPYVRAAGSWVMKTGTLPGGISAEADNPDQLLQLAMLQLDDGADFIKLYLDGPDPETPPWTAADVRRVVDAAHARGARVTAHAGRFAGTSVCADAGVDCVEHGFETDAETAAVMARRGVAMVTTMTVLKSWASFEHTTRLERFSSAEGRRLVHQRTEVARESVRLAYRAGVVLAAGTDFGGGSARPTRWHGRSRRWWTAGWNPGRRWRRPPGGAARSVASRRRG